MKVKKFTGTTMQNVMEQIRNELGQDAVILSSKAVQSGGFWRLFGKKNFEVVAAIDPDTLRQEKKVYTKSKSQPATEPADVMNPNMPKKTRTKEKWSDNPPTNEVLKELNNVKEMLYTQQQAMLSLSTYQHYPEPLREIYQELKTVELNESIIHEWMQELLGVWNEKANETLTSEDLMNSVRELLLNQLKDNYQKNDVPVKKYINMVGPTGVGKTTTIAKIAAEYMINQNKKIAFITTDTYRIGAIEQLKTYAQILNVPLEIAYNPKDFNQAIERFSQYDHIFIDTAGRNFRNSEYVMDLKKMIDFDLEMETYLILAATAKEKDMAAILEQFSILPVKGIIFTKIDETAQLGTIINFALEHKLPIVYLTNGQNVPDDLLIGSPKVIVENVFGGD